MYIIYLLYDGVNEISLEAFIKPVNAAMQSVNTFYPPPLQPAVFTIIYNYICIKVLNANRCELVRERRSIYNIYYIIASRFCHINIPASKKTNLHFFLSLSSAIERLIIL